mgnify:CR=1 FL=1
MVRINLIEPKKLADQHLVAEYNEILMLIGHLRNFPSLEGISEIYTLGTGHIKFFKNKLLYLKKRHDLIKIEMVKRGFETNKTLNLSEFGKEYCNDWKPQKNDFDLIKIRIREKIKMKPDFYRYYGEYKGGNFFLNLLK